MSTRRSSSGRTVETSTSSERTNYRSYKDATSIFVPLGAMAELLERKSILVAARQMALGLMRRGPSSFAKFHSDDLLDQVLLHREEPASA